MSKYFPSLSNVTKLFSWFGIILVVIVVIYGGYVAYSSFTQTPERVIQKFVSLIENPTQTVTEEEKNQLKSIIQPTFFSAWSSENDLKTLRRIAMNNPIQQSEVEYFGQTKRTAKAELTFDNTFSNPESKKAVVYMERIGNYFVGVRWQIYKIDMPKEDSIIESTTDKIKQESQSLIDKVRNAVER